MKHPDTILITGATGGIGTALAKAYARPGVTLALTGRRPERLREIAAATRSAGATVIEAAFDLRDGDALARWVAEVEATRPLDLVIAGAGITGGHRGSGHEENFEELRNIIDVNFLTACATVHAALPGMRRRQKGQIALISSLAGMRGLPYSPGYSASKAALITYAESLRAWLRADRIEVAIILPGFVDTPMAARVTGPKPLMLDPDRAALIIRKGLERGRPRVAFPMPLYLLQRAASLLPTASVDMVLNRVPVAIDPDK